MAPAGPAPTVSDPDRVARLDAARLYLRTPDRPDLPEFLQAVLANGVDVVRLAQAGLGARRELELCEVVADAAARHGALWAVTGRADLAEVAGADVLHLGQDDLAVPPARSLLGPGRLVGRSACDLDEAVLALVQHGVDYVCVGPGGSGARGPALDLDLLRTVAELDPVRPWFADGGLRDRADVERALAAGARRVVVSEALTEADDPGDAARSLALLLRAGPPA